MLFNKLIQQFKAIVCHVPHMSGGSGSFDSAVGYTSGTRDFQTGFGFDKTLFMEMRTKLMFSDLARSGDEVDSSQAGTGDSITGTTVIRRIQIDSGDEMRLTMDEAAKGMPTYGPKQHPSGDFSQYKNIVARVNTINGPALPIESEEDQARVKASIQNIPANVRAKAIVHMAEEIDAGFRYAMYKGASPSVLLAKSSGGLGHSLGVNAGGGAGVPLMNKWFYCGDAGFVSFSTTPATYNAAVDTAINTISTTSEHKLSLPALKIIRYKLDDIHFWPVRYMGKTWKAICLLDPELFWRLGNLLGTDYRYAWERGKDNPIFNGTQPIALDDVLYINDVESKKYRPSYNSASANGPVFGPNMTSDFRDYTTTSSYAMAVYLGANALIEGYRASMVIKEHNDDFDKGMQVAARTQVGVVHGEWYAKDGRTDTAAVQNYNKLIAVFYEPGVGSSYL